MADIKPQITCIGLANVDVIASVSDDFITSHHIAKGASTTLDACTTGSILGKLQNASFHPGGCAANTACGIAGFGVPVRYVGKVGDDSYAEMFRQGFAIHPEISWETAPYSQKMTSTCLTLVTPDKDRSFAFCTDTAGWFIGPDDLPDTSDNAPGHTVYLEANTALMNTGRDGRSLMEEAALKYRDTGTEIVINLNDREIVNASKPLLTDLLGQDIACFLGNAQEIFALFGTEDFEAICRQIWDSNNVFAITNGPDGAYLIRDGDVTHIPAHKLQASRIINTVGAGDQFAAGFLAARAENKSLEDACTQGIEAATAVIQQVSARPKIKRPAA